MEWRSAPQEKLQIPQIISDGSEGAIITWWDYRSGSNDIYARRVDASGTPQWGVGDGVAICTAGNTQSYPQIISDGSEGAIITWQDYRNGNYDIYVRRVHASGASLWAAWRGDLHGDGITSDSPSYLGRLRGSDYHVAGL